MVIDKGVWSSSSPYGVSESCTAAGKELGPGHQIDSLRHDALKKPADHGCVIARGGIAVNRPGLAIPAENVFTPVNASRNTVRLIDNVLAAQVEDGGNEEQVGSFALQVLGVLGRAGSLTRAQAVRSSIPERPHMLGRRVDSVPAADAAEDATHCKRTLEWWNEMGQARRPFKGWRWPSSRSRARPHTRATAVVYIAIRLFGVIFMQVLEPQHGQE